MSEWSPSQRLDLHPAGGVIKIQAATPWLSHEVMSPHQRALSLLASVLKSRRTRSARAAADGSGIVVFFHPRWRAPA